MKKYIIYAKKMVHPKLNEIDKEKVTTFYADIRRESNVVGGIPIAVRHIESVLRMSEAYAKVHLRDYVRSEDIDFAIDMMCRSFLQSQKLSVAGTLQKKLNKYLSKAGKNDNFSVLHHECERLCKLALVNQKKQRGIEDVETVTGEFTVAQFKGHLGNSFENSQVDEYLRSSLFKGAFQLNGQVVRFTRTL